MEEIEHDVSKAVFDEEELLMREVVQEDADLFYLHHYLTDLFRESEI